MNYGGIAYVRNNSIIVPDHLIRPLNAFDEVLTGIVYKRPEKYKGTYDNIDKDRKDFIFTPIPYDLWPFISQIKVRLIEKPGVINKLSKIFKQLKISVLSAECHSSGFRYLNWSAFIELHEIKKKYIQETTNKINLEDIKESIEKSNLKEDLKEKLIKLHDRDGRNEEIKILKEALDILMNEYSHLEDKRIKDYIKTISSLNGSRYRRLCFEIIKYLIKVDIFFALDKLNEELLSNSKNLIFKVDTGNNDNRPWKKRSHWPSAINITYGSPLAYHYWRIESIRFTNDADIEYQKSSHFEVNLKNNEIHFPDTIKNTYILNRNLKKRNASTFALVNINTDAPRIRVRLIDYEEIKKYYRVTVSFRSKQPTVGLLESITSILENNHYALYNMVNQTRRGAKTYEVGKIDFISKKLEKKLENFDRENIKKDLLEKIKKAEANVDSKKSFEWINRFECLKPIKIPDDFKYIETNKIENFEYYLGKKIDLIEKEVVSNDQNGLQEKIESKIIEKEGYEYCNVKVLPLNPFTIFLSFKSEFYFRENLVTLCKEVGTEIGLLENAFVIVNSSIHSVTENVVNQLRRCDGVLQFFLKLGGEQSEDFARWLDAEHLAAKALGKPLVRILNKNERVKPLIDIDTHSIDALNSSTSNSTLKKVIKEALMELILEINNAQNNNRFTSY